MKCSRSPSPRREGIEIISGEDVTSKPKLSPSPRREWIEIRETNDSETGGETVSLPTEGVD